MGWGTFHRCFFIGKNLAKLDHEIRLICASGKEFDLSISTQKIGGMEIVTIPRLKIKTEQLFQAIVNIALSLSKKCDVIHGFSVSQPATGIPVIFSTIFRRKLILADWDDYWNVLIRRKRRTINWVIDAFESGVPRLVDGTTVVSDFLFERAREIGIPADKIHKIPNGANVDEIKPMNMGHARKTLNLDLDCPLITCVGRSFFTQTLEVFSKVREELPDAKMLAVGIEHISSTAREIYKILKDEIIVVGRQPPHKIPYYLAAGNVLALPMENAPQDIARWPIRLGDYLASGKPIISNAVGEVKKVLEEDRCGLTCPPGDIGAFSEIAIKILNSQKLGERLGNKARKVAEEKYSWGRIVAKLDRLYSGLMMK